MLTPLSMMKRVGRVRVQLRINEKADNIREKIKACVNKMELREVLMKEKIWKVTFREQTAEDLVPDNGWCGYLSVD